MIKFNDLQPHKQVARVYLLSLITSLMTYPLFYQFYVFIHKPLNLTEGNLFMVAPSWFEKLFTITIFALYFVLPFYCFFLITTRPVRVWLIGGIIPFSVVLLVGNVKDIFWALILSVAGWGLAQTILFIRNKAKR